MNSLLFFLYSRKSVYTGKGESVENQIEMSRQYLFSKFGEIREEDLRIYEDEGFSGKNTNRPAFRRMLGDLKAEKPDYVVCYRLDRISRSVSDFSALIEDLNRRGVSFLCIREEFDTSKPMGKAMMYIASVFAQLERETIAERVRDNMLLLARTGRWLGGTTPTGFVSEKEQTVFLDGKVKTACRLMPDPAELRTVRLIFDSFLSLQSVSGVSRLLKEQGIRSRTGRPFSLPGIKEILQNPVYCTADREAFRYFTARQADLCFSKEDCSEEYGLLSYNKRDYKQRSAPRQSTEKWIVAIGKHPGLIPGRRWAAVQALLKKGSRGERRAPPHNGYALLSGLLTCGACGGHLFAKPRAVKSGGPPAFDYLCEKKLRGRAGGCACQNLNGKKADEAVWNALLPYCVYNGPLPAFLERQKRKLRAGGIQGRTNASARLEGCRREMDRLVEALAQGGLGEGFGARLRLRAIELEEEASRLEAALSSPPAAEKAANALARELSSLKSLAHSLSVPEKRALIRLLTKKLVWDGQDLHLFLGAVPAKGPAPEEPNLIDFPIINPVQ